jgi:integrase
MTAPMSHSFNELLLRYQQEYFPHLTPGTRYAYGLLFRRLGKRYGELAVETLTPDVLRAWRDELQQTRTSGTVRVYMGALAGALRFAVEELEWLPSHPMARVRKPPKAPERVRFLDEDERSRLLAACQQSRNPFLSTLVLLALTTGARKNELRRLQWTDVDLRQGFLKLSRTKNGEKRSVPVVGPALDRLRAQAEAARPGWVFPSHRSTGPVGFQKAWERARDRAGLLDFRWHDLRHTAASYLAMSGASLREIAEILGHKTLQQTMKYAHLTAPHTTGIVERMAAQFLTPPADGRP